MNDIEVELKIFLTEEKYSELLDFFKREAEFLSEDEQETHYFQAKDDLRIQKNNFFSKIVLKKGGVHDEIREEMEIKCDKGDFNKLEKLFANLEYPLKIKWLRKRLSFKWGEVSVCLDFTKGYGYILELEKMASEENKQEALTFLRQKAKELNLEVTPKEEFDKKYNFYKENWKNLI